MLEMPGCQAFYASKKNFGIFFHFTHFREENYLNLRYIIKLDRVNADKKLTISPNSSTQMQLLRPGVLSEKQSFQL